MWGWKMSHKASITENITESSAWLLITEGKWKLKSKYLPFTVLGESQGDTKNIQFLTEYFGPDKKMWFKVKWSSVDVNAANMSPSLSDKEKRLMKQDSIIQTKIIDLPDDVLLILFKLLSPRDLIRYSWNLVDTVLSLGWF